MYISGMLRDHSAFVLDDVAGAGATLDGHVAQARVDADVHAVEGVGGAADVVGESLEVVEIPNFAGFTSRNVSGYPPPSGSLGRSAR